MAKQTAEAIKSPGTSLATSHLLRPIVHPVTKMALVSRTRRLRASAEHGGRALRE